MAEKRSLFFNNDPECPVKAAGLILTRKQQGCPHEYLLQIRKYANDKNRPRWLPLLGQNDGFYDVLEDFGGKIEDSDQTVEDIIVREASEESNGQFDMHSLRERLALPSARYCYNKDCKYLFVLLPASETESILTGEEFGERENHVSYVIQRTVRWMTIQEVRKMRRNMHIRLRVPMLYKK